MQVNMHEAKSQLSKLGEKAIKGEKVVIAKAGTPYLDLVPHQKDNVIREPGRLKEYITLNENFDDTDDVIIASFEDDL